MLTVDSIRHGAVSWQWVILIPMLPDLISQLPRVETKLYGEIEKQIATARQKEEEVIYASHTWVK
ncbi:hypothetical protein [Microcoleus sp. Pol11C2]|uniref:hypothetical protein n=1 Tax=Microcoleus sp. Pol11C2 TaxID=3055389 RepID=UPI002FD6E931